MANRRYFYLTEGECEEKLINALKMKPALVQQGKVKKFNIIQNELQRSQLMMFASGSTVVLVFDTDVEVTAQLKKNIELLKTRCTNVEVLTIAEVLNFENEIERATDVKVASDLTRSKSIREFKSAVNKMKPMEFRRALKRHKLDMDSLWAKQPPKGFKFIAQDGDRIKC